MNYGFQYGTARLPIDPCFVNESETLGVNNTRPVSGYDFPDDCAVLDSSNYFSRRITRKELISCYKKGFSLLRKRTSIF